MEGCSVPNSQAKHSNHSRALVLRETCYGLGSLRCSSLKQHGRRSRCAYLVLALWWRALTKWLCVPCQIERAILLAKVLVQYSIDAPPNLVIWPIVSASEGQWRL